MPDRPTTEVSVVILDSLEGMYVQLIDRLEGLAEDEYLWEPVPGMWSVQEDGSVDGAGLREVEPAPPTTIAWRMWHVALDCLDDYARRFGGDDSDAPARWTRDPDEAIDILEASWNKYRDTVAARSWWDELGPGWGPWAQHSVADMVLHAGNEMIHHGAEIALLRDLYRAGPQLSR